jgi:hypothetical protein
MHIHGNSMNLNAVDLHATAAAEKAASTQRAAEVRKKLMRGGLEMDGELNPESSFMVGLWSEGGSQQQQQGHERASTSRGPLNADEELADKPVSVWA